MLSPPPRDFTNAEPMGGLDTDAMILAVKNGKPETAMQPFESILTDTEITSVVAFIRHAFIDKRAGNIEYHSPENGWPNFRNNYGASIQYFLNGADSAAHSDKHADGKDVFDLSCVTCHLRRTTTAPTTTQRKEVWISD